jgi:hypothetical protein
VYMDVMCAGFIIPVLVILFSIIFLGHDNLQRLGKPL